MKKSFFAVFLLFACLGCQAMRADKSVLSDQKEARESLKAVAEALGGEELTDEEFADLQTRVEKDKDAQEAIKAISDSMSGSAIKVKYCPVTGKRFAPTVERCPIHDVKLEYVGD